MDIDRDRRLTIRLPKNLKEKLNDTANKLEITANSYIKVSLYILLNMYAFRSDMKLDTIISDIPSGREDRISLDVSDELNNVLKVYAKKYSLTVNELILVIIMASLKNYDDNTIKGTADDFQSRLKLAFENKGISQAELARRSGLSRASVTDYLKGKYKPKADATYALAKALGVDVSWLLGYQ